RHQLARRRVAPDVLEQHAAGDVDARAVTVQDLVEDALARTEVVVERGDVALPGRLDDLAHGDLIEPAPSEQPLRFAQQERASGSGVAGHGLYRSLVFRSAVDRSCSCRARGVRTAATSRSRG